VKKSLLSHSAVRGGEVYYVERPSLPAVSRAKAFEVHEQHF